MAVREKIENILRKVAESAEISSFEVIPDENVLKGDGLMSECYTGGVRNNDTGELIQTYIKVPPQYDTGFGLEEYQNEYAFYSKIFPALDKFQREKQVKDPFDKIPKFYCGSVESQNVYVALENLKLQDYVLHDKKKFIDEAHLKLVFEAYGKYHALTFAFKDRNREEHERMVGPLFDVFVKLEDRKGVRELQHSSLKIAYDVIKEIDEAKAARIKPLLSDPKETFSRGLKYRGKHSALIHGDCWSNNILFKYNANGEPESMKLLDHQLLRDSTPIHDLSYFFYAGAGKKDFDKLDEYLGLYYKSFASFARELGSDPDRLLPLDALKTDWKTYSFLGITMALIVWPIKLIDKEELANITDPKHSFSEKFRKVYATDAFKNIVADMLLHAVEYGII